MEVWEVVTNQLPTGMPTTYPPPRTPLPPHKLAKIANAFGVSSPLPHISSFPRSETLSPSSASTASFVTTRSAAASKFLLHVIPPVHLPCNKEEEDDLMSNYGDDDDNESVMTAQQQFRRGVLVPLQPTLQAQLGSIAREYSLPTTGGMMLYLTSSSPSPGRSTSPTTPTPGTGPRISDHVWTLLWHRVLRTEREDSARSLLGVGSSLGLSSLPSFSRSPTVDGSHGIQTPSSTRSRSPAPSPLSNAPYSPPLNHVSGLPSRLQYSVTNQSTPYLPSTDYVPSPEPDYDPLTDFNLNFGQGTDGLLPILAQVEFDIDRHSKAGAWYETFREKRTASNRQRQAEREARQPPKKKKFILPARRDTLSERERTMAEEIERLRALVANSSMVSRSNGFSRLPEGDEDDDSEYGEGSDIDETEMLSTSIISGATDRMFSDEGALRDIRRAKRESNTHLDLRRNASAGMPKLKLDGAALTEEGEEEEEEGQAQEDENEVLALWESKNRPILTPPELGSVSSSSSNQDSTHVVKEVASPPRRTGSRPPPLDLSHSVNRSAQLQTPTPVSGTATSGSSARLAYLSSPNGSLPPSGGASSGTSSGDPRDENEQDEDDTWGDDASRELPIGERSSMIGEEERAELEREKKLDEIEKRIAQFSPRSSKSFHGGDASISTVLGSDFSHHADLEASMTTNNSVTEELILGPPRTSSIIPQQEAPPPLPAKAVSLKSAMKPSRPPPPPPSKDLPLPAHQASTSVSSGSMLDVSPNPRLRNELDWPPAPSPDRRSGLATGSPPDSPSYPMSPDPFRRPDWSQNPPVPPTPEDQAKLNSRFSADSEYDQNSFSRASGGSQRQRSNSIVSVKNIRNLWRKSGTSQNEAPIGIPAVPSLPHSAPPTTSNETEPVPPLPLQYTGKHMKRPSIKAARDSDADPFHFDQVKSLPSSAPAIPADPASSSSSLVNSNTNTNASNTGSVRKSILKAWKGATPPATASSAQEVVDEKDRKKRRPSVLDFAGNSAKNVFKRNSRSSRSSVASTINGAVVISSTSRPSTPDPAVLLGEIQANDGLLSAGPGSRPPLSVDGASLRTPQRTNFEIPSPRMPSAPQGSWI